MNTIIKQKLKLPNLFEDFFNVYNTDLNRNNYPYLSANVKNEEKHFLIEMATPGLKKQDIKIIVEDDLLKISSEFLQVKDEKDIDNYTLKEFNYNGFNRTFKLPKYVLKEKISAKYDDGLLKLVIPKEENEDKTAIKIEVA